MGIESENWFAVHVRDTEGYGKYDVHAPTALDALEKVVGFCATHRTMPDVIDIPLCPTLVTEPIIDAQIHSVEDVVLRSHVRHTPVNLPESLEHFTGQQVLFNGSRSVTTPQD